MATRPVAIIMEPTEAQEAPGVLIRRTIGAEKMILLDPFLLLDHLGIDPKGAGDNPLGFPRHPHRGIETLTYVMQGAMKHSDSMGNDDTVGEGESQWMTAGGGLFHSETPEVKNGGHNSIQIWFNLPADQKMMPPAYHPARNADIPEVTGAGGSVVRVIAGEFAGTAGAFQGIAVHPTYLAVHLPAGASVTLPAKPSATAFAYIYKGKAAFGEEAKEVEAARLVVFADGDGVIAQAGDADAEFIFVSATPLNEPVFQYRSLVLNTVDQMKQALDDLAQGTFERK